MKDVDLPEARRDLVRELGWPNVPQLVWEELLTYNRGDVEQAFGTQDWEEVAVLAREIQASQRGRAGPPQGGVPYSRTFDYISDRERDRLEVRAEVLAKHAASDEAVQAFRDRFLGGELLAPEQAQEFVTSLANQNLPVQWFDKHGVSFLGHTIDTRTSTSDYRGKIIEFTIWPAGIDCRVEKHALSEEYGGGATLSVAGDPSDVRQRRRNDVSLPIAEEGRDPIAHDGLLDLGYWRGFTGYVRTDSPLGALRDLGVRLTKRYRGWKRNYATRFVLTGEPPKEVSPLWTEGGSGGEIVMHVAPWISPESVKNAYMRELWFRGWSGERYGGSKAKRQRSLGPKTIPLLRFITARIDRIDDSHERRAKGRKIAAQWDAMYPCWAYRGDTRTMWRDYSRALEQVVPSSSDKNPAQQRVEKAAKAKWGEV